MTLETYIESDTYDGSDAWVRAQFEDYTLSLICTVTAAQSHRRWRLD